MSAANVLYEPAQDYIYLGGLKSPGLATVKSANSPRGWDKREGYGFSGASTVFHGAKLGDVEVEFYLWEDAHWLYWNNVFSLLLLPPKGASATGAAGVTSLAGTTGLGIYHPQISNPPIGISSVVVEDVSAFMPDDYGGWTCTVKFIEFRPPLPVLAKPLLAIPSVTKPAPTAKDAADAEIARKLAEFNALAAGK